MRQIKFRAWDKKKKRMISETENLTNVCVDGRVIVLVRYGADGRGMYEPKEVKQLTWPEAENLELMQFTGLLDKNGKEIYEGDILMLHGKDPADTKYHPKRVMEWGYAGFQLRKKGMPEKNATIRPKPALMKDFEVLGNIYENPELLETN